MYLKVGLTVGNYGKTIYNQSPLNKILQQSYKLESNKMNTTVNSNQADPLVKASTRRIKEPSVAKPKPSGKLVINADLEKHKRPKMVADMAKGQVFVREGKLCMRVLNVCNNNVKGQASKADELWIINLNEGKVLLSSNIPVELVDIEISVVNK